MLTFNEERQYIDGEFEAFAEMYKEFGLSIDGEIYLTHSKQWEKIYFVLSFKPFAPKVQDDMITTDNRVVLGMFAKKYNLNPDQERRLQKVPKGLRKVYYSKQRFRNALKIEFSKTADKRELQSYVHYHGGRMCEKAANICSSVRRLHI